MSVDFIVTNRKVVYESFPLESMTNDSLARTHGTSTDRHVLLEEIPEVLVS
jgi:hypothetical protein